MPREARLRLLLVDAGLPEPVRGYELRGPRGWIGWFDLALDAGWHPVHARASDLRPDARHDTVARFRRALRT